MRHQRQSPTAATIWSDSNGSRAQQEVLSEYKVLGRASGAGDADGGASPHVRSTPIDARYKPGRASSPEITVASSDETADGRDRKRGHETLLKRRRSLRTDEMATNGGRARTPSPPVSPKEAQKRPNQSMKASTAMTNWKTMTRQRMTTMPGTGPIDTLWLS